MTVAQLMSNVVIAAKRQTRFDQKWDLSYLSLSPLEKVCTLKMIRCYVILSYYHFAKKSQNDKLELIFLSLGSL